MAASKQKTTKPKAAPMVNTSKFPRKYVFVFLGLLLVVGIGVVLYSSASRNVAADLAKYHTLAKCPSANRPTLALTSPRINHPCVAYLQAALNKANGSNLEPDGIFGPATRRAVVSFQNNKKHRDFEGKVLEVDGKVGPRTWSALDKSVPPTKGTVSTASPTPKPTVTRNPDPKTLVSTDASSGYIALKACTTTGSRSLPNGSSVYGGVKFFAVNLPSGSQFDVMSGANSVAFFVSGARTTTASSLAAGSTYTFKGKSLSSGSQIFSRTFTLSGLPLCN